MKEKLQALIKRHQNWYQCVVGVLSGTANGLFGSGGGVLAVPLLEFDGTQTRKAHASSIGITLPLSVISAGVYWYKGSFALKDTYPYLLPGLAGAVLGALCLKKISSIWLERAFALVMIAFGVRLLVK